MDELVINGSDALGAEIEIDSTEATADVVIESDFSGIEIDAESI